MSEMSMLRLGAEVLKSAASASIASPLPTDTLAARALDL
jgi:hypothetical protein